MSFEFIRPFLSPIAHLLADEEVTEIMINAPGNVFFERHGRIHPDTATISERHRQTAARNIARLLGDEISEEQPLFDGRIPDGSRIAAVMPPASVGGTVINIRRFRKERFTAQELVERRMLTAEMLEFLKDAIAARQNILISGGTGGGKTTLLNALAAFLPSDDRIIVIEDTSEISLSAPNVVTLEARRAQPEFPAITIRDLLRQTLRLRPDRIILGEVRGAEAFDLMQALNTGHSGTLSTIHANSAALAISRLRTCIAVAGVDIPDRAIARNVAETIQVVVQIMRRDGLRFVSEIMRLDRYDAEHDRYDFTPWSTDPAPN